MKINGEIYIIEKDACPSGCVRFRHIKMTNICLEKLLDISIDIMPKYRHKVIAQKILKKACAWALKNTDHENVLTRVKLDNRFSLKLFCKRNFPPISQPIEAPYYCLLWPAIMN